MSLPKSPVNPSLYLCAIFLIATSFFSACSNGSTRHTDGPGATAPGTGSVAFQLVWQQPLSSAHAEFTPSFNACVDRAIDTIAATVSNGTTTITNSWPCSAHGGLISGVPAGTNYTVQVDGFSSEPTTTILSGMASPITVTTGQTTDAGTIVMSYVGGDTAQPSVTSIRPNSWDYGDGKTTVPVTDRIIVAFNKPMAISTITAANITLKLNGNSPVPGTVSYNGAGNSAAFTPSAPLAYNAEYLLQVISCITVTNCITDTAGNTLASDYPSTFMTESDPVGVPDTPFGVTAIPGNGQVTLDWRAPFGATSYNVYYGTSTGIYTTQIPGARAPFVHLGLVNNQTYYYIITAVNSFGESLATVEASATPAFPAGNPLPPASIAVSPSSGQNIVTWYANGATSYNLYWSTMPISPDKYAADNVVRDVTSPYIHTGLTDGLPYCYIITAMNPSGESADSMQACGGIGTIQIIW
jgi:hypothetical protein